MTRSALKHPRLFLALVAGALCAAATASFVISGAGFSQASSTPTTEVAAAHDWVAPTIDSPAIATTAAGTPIGAAGYVRPSGTYRIYANVTDTISGVSSVTADASALTSGAGAVPLVAGSYTVGVTSYGYASAELTVDSGASAGVNAFSIQATDGAGNTRTDATPTVVVDTAGPEVTQEDPGTPLRRTVDLTAAATDATAGVASVRIEHRPAASGTWTTLCTDTGTPYTCAWDTLAGSDGMYDLRAVALDNAGNTTTSAVVGGRQVDNAHPGVTMTDPGPYVRGPIVLTTTTSPGGSEIATVRIEFSPVGAGTWTTVCTDTTDPFDCSVDTTQVSDGTYDVRAVAIDAAGNEGISQIETSVVDNTNPSSATLTAPATPMRGTITLTGTAADATSGIASRTFQLAPGTTSSWADACVATMPATSCPFDTTTVADGIYQFRMIATDRAGNTRTSPTSTNRRVDNTGPTVTMTDPGAAFRATISLAATASDAGSGMASVRYQRSPAGAATWTDVCTGATSPFSCPWDTTTSADGLYDLRAIATDLAGNATTSAALTDRRVDNTAPTGVALTNPGSPLRAAVSLTGTASDAGSGIATLRFQRAPGTTTTWTDACVATAPATACAFDTATVADGLYQLRLIATDAAGNATTSAAVTNRRIDNTAPAVTIANPGTYLKGNVSLSASATDGGSGVASVTLQSSPAGQGAWSAICTGPASPLGCAFPSASVPDGAYDLQATATDVAGNVGTSATLANRIVDNTAPEVTLDAIGDRIRGTVTLTASATDLASPIASVRFQRAPTGTGTWTDMCTDSATPFQCAVNTTSLTSGATYDFRAVATDAATNEGVSNIETAVVDNTRPTALNIVTANTSGGTAGMAEPGDSMSLTFSEAMDLTSILAGWDGSATSVTLRFEARSGAQADRVTIYDAANGTQLALGTVTLGRDYVSANATFSATMQQNATAMAFVLGTPSSAASFLEGQSSRATWQPSSDATDLAGNAAQTTTFTQPAPNRLHF